MGCYKIVLNLSKPAFNTSTSNGKVYVAGKQTGWYKDPKTFKTVTVTETATGNGDYTECTYDKVVGSLKISLTKNLKYLTLAIPKRYQFCDLQNYLAAHQTKYTNILQK